MANIFFWAPSSGTVISCYVNIFQYSPQGSCLKRAGIGSRMKVGLWATSNIEKHLCLSLSRLCKPNHMHIECNTMFGFDTCIVFCCTFYSIYSPFRCVSLLHLEPRPVDLLTYHHLRPVGRVVWPSMQPQMCFGRAFDYSTLFCLESWLNQLLEDNSIQKIQLIQPVLCEISGLHASFLRWSFILQLWRLKSLRWHQAGLLLRDHGCRLWTCPAWGLKISGATFRNLQCKKKSTMLQRHGLSPRQFIYIYIYT